MDRWSTIAAWEIEVARLTARRVALGWSHEQAAAIIGCHANSLGRWERLDHPPSIENWLLWRRGVGLSSPWPMGVIEQQVRVAFRDAIMDRARKD